MDQGSFLGLRALGRGPVLQFTWIYEHPLDETALREFGERLSQGLLGRVLQRSPLPWGRHRWVACREPAPVTWFEDPIAVELLPECLSRLVELPVDPEFGPGWRLAVQRLEGGGCVLSMLVSHTIADGKAAIQAIVDAVADRRLQPGYSAPSWRWSPVMVARDIAESLRNLPDAVRALSGLVRRARLAGAPLSGSAKRPGMGGEGKPEPTVYIPRVDVILDRMACEDRADELRVTSNMLLAAFAARLGFRMGRVDAAGRVNLVLPISDRQPDDRRGNALSSVSVMTDAEACRTAPRALQDAIMAEMIRLRENGDDRLSMLPLVPFAPHWLARRVESLALGSDLPVGCSLLGELPTELNQPCGEALQTRISSLERFTASLLQRHRGGLYIICHSSGPRVFVTVSGYAPDRASNRAELAPLVRDALEDLGLAGVVV